MARSILVLRCHPAPVGGHFCDALVEAYQSGATSAGHRVDSLDLAVLDIPFLRTAEAWKTASPSADIRLAQAKIAVADHLVFIYPLWLGDMPALLKAFLEQVACEGFVMSVDDKGRWQQGLKGKSTRIIVTMGMPALIYRFYFFSHSLRSFKRNILGFAGVSPVSTTVIGSVDKSAGHRKGWIASIRSLGEQGK
jgi:putative NADPH-quinone reductase